MSPRPDPNYEEHKTDFARSIDRQVNELRNITNAYWSFIEHLGTLEAFLRALAGRFSQPPIDDLCRHCGVDGARLRKEIRGLAAMETPI